MGVAWGWVEGSGRGLGYARGSDMLKKIVALLR